MPEGYASPNRAAPLQEEAAPQALLEIAPPPQITLNPLRYDASVLPARLEQPSFSDEQLSPGVPEVSAPEEAEPRPMQVPPPSDSRRRLAAPRERAVASPSSAKPKFFDISWSNLPLDPTTTGAALAMVVGLFLLTVTLFKRAAPKSQRLLPSEVASVVGRIPLGGKQVAQLLKVGSKLVLVCVTPEGVKPLTEVTDPAEVTRLLGLCEQGGDYSATTAFRDVFDKLAGEQPSPGFLGDEAPLVNRQQLADAYANTPGGRGSV